ncbi:MAG TPA: lysylphosphatidylglycerol synthase domain-containing protein [Gaiellaceae bacterium]|nr:lysylphosphatidylglycerol synthase domain-containing protein [Gaiellaceae bacterium]
MRRRGPGFAAAPRRARVVAGSAFAALALTACVLLGRRLTHSSWPLAHASALPVAGAALCYFLSFVLRARGWQMLFPREARPAQAGCLASVGAAAASGIVLPFRLDYLIKVGTLRRLGGIRLGLEAIVLSIVSLGIVDAVAMLPLSISATATTSASMRGPLLIVVAFGLGCCAVLVASARLVRLPLLRRSGLLLRLADGISRHRSNGRRSAIAAGVYLLACWTTRAVGSTLLLSALGLRFSPTTALCVLCLSAASGVVPVAAGGAAVNVGATAAILLALGVGRDVAINFSLASGLLLVTSASAAAASGLVLSLAVRAAARRRPAPRPA